MQVQQIWTILLRTNKETTKYSWNNRRWCNYMLKVKILTARIPPLLGKLSVRGSSSLDGSKPCFSTHWRATSTRLPLLPLVPSFAAISVLLPITMNGTGRPHGPPDPRGAENVPVAAISAAHFCKLAFVLLWERSWTKITPAQVLHVNEKCWTVNLHRVEYCRWPTLQQVLWLYLLQ